MTAGSYAKPAIPLACVLGDPITHSLSPRLHEAALADSGIVGRYLAFQTGVAGLAETLRSLSALGFRGCNLTAPLKVAARSLLHEEDSEVRRIGAVNTIVFAEGSLIGYNTDARGLLTALRTVAGFEPGGKRILILGSGGAARAAVSAMTDAGALRVYLSSRSRDRAQGLIDSFDDVGIEVCQRTDGLLVDLVINATTVGMRGGGNEGEAPIALANLGRCDLVYDMVYRPTLTPLLMAAKQLGVSAFDGRSMLAAQARFAFEHFFGVLPSLDSFMKVLAVEDEDEDGG